MKRTLIIVSICIALMMAFTTVIATQTALFDANAATINISKTKR